MLLLDVTVVNVALPAIRSDLDASFAELQWVIDAYALTLAATLLTAGALADRHGRRAVFAAGLVLFSAFSALCAAAGSGARARPRPRRPGDRGRGDVRRIAGAARQRVPGRRARLRARHLGRDHGRRAWRSGHWSAGCWWTARAWRWVFLINLPLGAVLTWLTLRSLPESRDPSPRGLDLPGLVSFGAASFLGTLGLIRGNEDGWTSAPVLGSLAASALLLACFVAVERRAREPMLAPALFRIPAFMGTAVVAFAQSVALYPLFLFLAVYLQEGLAYSATETGLRLLPLTLVLLAVAPISGRLTGRIGLRAPLVTGLVLIAVALLLMRGLEPTSSWTHLLPGFVVGGLAIGVISPALAAAMVGVLSAEQVGLASGINNTFRQLGIAVGIAVLGAVFTHHADGGLPGLVDGLNAVFAVAAAIAAAGAVIAWPLLRGFAGTVP